MTPPWKSLRLSNDNVPQLLVKAKLDSSGYSILITDLSRVWAETLTKREIIRRAVKRDCTIDPSEGDDQYTILLGKIQQALDQEDETMLDLRTASDRRGALTLSLTAPLPSPLPPFKWDAELKQLPPRGIEGELVQPLLHQAQSLHHQVQQLMHELADKDRVISRITDKLEQSGNDLTDVFPGISNIKMSKKKSQREQLAKYVKGLSEFDESMWRSQHDGSLEGEKLEAGNLDVIMRNVPDGDGSVEPVATYDEAEEWWQTIGGGGGTNANGRSNLRPSLKTEHMPQTYREDSVRHDSDDDDFQRQSTPSRMKPQSASKTPLPALHANAAKSQQLPTARTMDDEETEDEDNLGATQPPPKAAKLGSIGWRPASRPQAADIAMRRRSPSPSEPSLKSPGVIGRRSKDSTTPEPEADATSTKARPRLGAIGGRGRTSTTPLEAQVEPEPVPSHKSSPATKHKLCAIGARGASTNPSSSSQEPPQAFSATKATKGDLQRPERQAPVPERHHEALSPSREAAEDRANRNRDELKRRLEAEAKAPVKKKRKF